MVKVFYDDYQKEIEKFKEGRTLEYYRIEDKSKVWEEHNNLCSYDEYKKLDITLLEYKTIVNFIPQRIYLQTYEGGVEIKIKGSLMRIDYEIDGVEKQTWRLIGFTQEMQ